MLRKILVWSIFTGFVGILIFGAVNRASARTDKYSTDVRRAEEWIGTVQANGGSSGRNLSETNNQGHGEGGINESNQPTAAGQSRGSGNGNRVESGSSFYWGDAEDHITEVVVGLVVEISPEIIRVEAEDDVYEIEGRTLGYLSESGFLLEKGDLVELTGFYEDGEYKVSVIQNVTSGQSILVRDESGRPKWSRGRSGN